MVQKIRENWQILTAVLFLWSFFDLYNYYNSFGVNIESYVSLSELLLLVLPTIIHGIIALLFLVFLMLYLASGKGVNTVNNDSDSSAGFLPFKRDYIIIIQTFRSKRYFQGTIHFFVSLVVYLTIIAQYIFAFAFLFFLYTDTKINILKPIGINYTNKSFFLFMFSGIGLLPIILLVGRHVENSKNRFTQLFSFISSPITAFVVLFVFTSAISNRVQYQLIVHGKGEKRLSFEYSKELITTSSSLIFIGNTQSYIFLRDNIDSSVVIFKKDQISNLKIK